MFPPVSVVIPTFNPDEKFAKTLNSIAHQTVLPDEVLIIDDASDPQSCLLLKKLIETSPIARRIRLRSLQSNVGPGEARNIGIGIAKNNHIALIDDDDLWFPDKLSIQLKAHQEIGCDFSCTAYKFGLGNVSTRNINYKSLLKK